MDTQDMLLMAGALLGLVILTVAFILIARWAAHGLRPPED
jgi:hypothetical protein